MSTETLSRPDSFASLSADNDNFDVNAGNLDIHIRRAVARMLDYCQSDRTIRPFLARGLVIDTMGDIEQQIRDYFPAKIDVTPVIDDIVLVATNTAKKSQQRFQEITLSYVADGKIPDVEDANKQNFVKWYSVDAVSHDGDFDKFSKRLNPGWSGGAGGSGADMLRHLNLATKKGFLLVVSALDITDSRVQDLLADMDIVQAFGANPEAINQIVDIIAAGGAPARQVEATIRTLVDIKNLKAAITNADGTPQAVTLATALALKVEALAITLPTLQTILPPAAMRDITRHVETIKIDMGARQMARAIEIIAASPLPANNVTTAQVIKAIDAVKKAAADHNLKIADVLTLVMTKAAPPALMEPVKKLMALLARPEVLPAIERSLPSATGAMIREALVTSPLALAAATPVSAQSVISTLQSLADRTANRTLASAAVMLAVALPAAPQMQNFAAQHPVAGVVSQSVLPPMQNIQTVVENLRAMEISKHTPPEVRGNLSVVIPVIEAAAVQMREPAIIATPKVTMQPEVIVMSLQQAAQATNNPTLLQAAQILQAQPSLPVLQNVADNLTAMQISAATPAAVKAEITKILAEIQPMTAPRAPEIVSQASPLATISKAVDLPAPTHVAPKPVMFTQPGNDVSKIITKGPDTQPEKPEAKKEDNGLCGTCKNGFNCASCAALGTDFLSGVKEAVNADVLADYSKHHTVKLKAI